MIGYIIVFFILFLISAMALDILILAIANTLGYGLNEVSPGIVGFFHKDYRDQVFPHHLIIYLPFLPIVGIFHLVKKLFKLLPRITIEFQGQAVKPFNKVKSVFKKIGNFLNKPVFK